MKIIFSLIPLFVAAGLALAEGNAAAVKWKDRAYAGEFCVIEEAGRYDAESWEALTGEMRARELERAGAGGRPAERGGEVRAYYEAMTDKWTLEEFPQKYPLLDGGGLRAVRIWLGPDHAAYLERKRAALAPLRAADVATLTEEAVRAAAQYLEPGAAARLKGAQLAVPVSPEADAKYKKRQVELSGKMDGIKTAYGDPSASAGGNKFFDGSLERAGGAGGPDVRLSKTDGRGAGTVAGDNYRRSHASTVAGGMVPEIAGAAAPARKKADFAPEDLTRIDSVVAAMKQKRQAAGSENGWLGNFRQTVGLSKADSGCSGWSAAAIDAIKNDPVLSQKYEAGYVRGLRNPLAAVTKWPPSVPLPLPHFVAVVWPKGTDPNDTAIYVDSWAAQTKRGPIREYTYEYSFDPKDMTPTVYYDRQVQKEIKGRSGKTIIVTETVETSISLIKANPWIFVGK